MEEGCILWLWGKIKDGYGCIRHEGKMVLVHRLAYCQANGLDLSDIHGKLVRHTCDNPHCCNPDHLVLGNHQDNSNDMVLRDRSARVFGPENNKGVLTDEQVVELFLSKESSVLLAAKYPCTASHIRAIRSRSKKSHLTQGLTR